MAASLKGQLGVKSGPLAPTSAKLTTQMLVISHMDNHYKKINKAKPAIDNRPPKSMVSSQKMRDRRSRKQIEKYGSSYGSRPSSRLTYRTNSVEEDIYDENQWDEPEDDDERQVRDIMRTTLRGPLKAQHGIVTMQSAADDSNLKDERSRLGMTMTRPRSASMQRVAVQGASQLGQTRPMSARSTASVVSHFSQVSRTTNPSKVTYDGDVLDKHAHSFTEPRKPFTPRTLKSNRQSSLKQYKYYTPPPKKAQSSRGKSPDVGADERGGGTQVKSQRGSAKDLDTTQTLTETMLMDMSLQSHDHRQSQGDSGVPRLNISMDKDHLSWVKDQAARVHSSDSVVA
ncbi:spermatogenesis-associated protein 7-like [Babylonia areolata]|uniref:spermatogenesis-associated protein 7-like n=1 Tax=Babylonia areolata TaxID=304850 RepID=UPI003FD4B8F0